MPSPPEVMERYIPEGQVINLHEVLCDNPESGADYQIIEDLVSSALFSQFNIRRQLAAEALSGFMGTPVKIFKMTSEHEIFAYLTLNGIEDGFFFVCAYPNLYRRTVLEPVPTEAEINALRNWIN